jgi:transcriptional regulator with XRE-family HTH domain
LLRPRRLGHYRGPWLPWPVAKRLKRLRRVQGLSQAALATKARISRGYLLRLEAARQDPTLGVLARLAKALGVPVAALLE